MGISLHITSVREGTAASVIHFMNSERATGNLDFSFGRHIPSATISFKHGALTSAEFGELNGKDVLDLLICQECAIKEINFREGTAVDHDDASLEFNLNELLIKVWEGVEKCEARPFIFGLLHVTFPEDSGQTQPLDSLLQVFHEFSKHERFLESIKPKDEDKEAPLRQCVLLRRALDENIVQYKTPLVALKSLAPLLDIVQPLDEKEIDNLRGYMRSLSPHPRATHMPLERYYAFVSAIESMAYRRSSEKGDKVRSLLYRKGPDDDGDGSAPSRIPLI